MTERVRRLREQSLLAVPHLNEERALLVTEAYRMLGTESAPVRRARVFYHILSKKAIYIGDDELIVGERGPAPKATSTYPEICCHSLQDLEILTTRPTIPYHVGPETRDAYEKVIIPFWGGKTLRETIFEEMTEEWNDAYAAGIFTEFMEQRAPGHTVLDGKIYRKGMLEFSMEIDRALTTLDFHGDPAAFAKSV